MNRKIIIGTLGIIIILIGILVITTLNFDSDNLSSPFSVVDGVGRTVTIEEYADRIVSIAPSCTEILFALGLEDKVVGVPTYSGYSPKIQEKIDNGDLTTVGTFSQTSIETVVSLDPQLILSKSGYQLSTAEKLAELEKTVVVLTHEGFSGLLDDISLVGKVTGYTKESETFVASMDNKAQEIIKLTENLQKPRVYVEYYFNGGFASYGSGSVVDELILMSGGVNVFAGFSGQYMETSTEEILKANPEIIIISKGVMSEACGLTPQTLRERAGWDETDAVKNNQIFEVDENLITVAGPKIVEGLEELAQIFHPELYE